MSKCRFCGTGGLQWTSQDGRWILHYPDHINNKHRCALSIAFYTNRNDVVIQNAIDAYLRVNVNGTTDPTVISYLLRGMTPPPNDGTIPQVIDAVSAIFNPPAEFTGMSNRAVVVGNGVAIAPGSSAEVTPSSSNFLTVDVSVSNSDILVWQGVWSSTTHYSTNDVVIWQSVVYRCKSSTHNSVPGASKPWKRLTPEQQRNLHTILQNTGASAFVAPVTTQRPAGEPIRAIKL